jgi:2-polyprenyl-6-hydroxyphenyl methylase/3-demethylubiquinone-9 3-methyltransferase
MSSENIDEREVSCFEHHGNDWWEPEGTLKALHDINPLRLSYVADRCRLEGRRVLDVGCGGGIFSEALARAGGEVTGIDLAPSALAAAEAHRELSGRSIDYRQTTAEDLAGEMPSSFDVICSMELLEHVPDPRSILEACRALAKPGGDIFLSTINRTWLSRLLVIFVAENVLRIVEKGTHHYEKLIPPQNLARWAGAAGLEVCDRSGYLYLPFLGKAWLTRGAPMNYMMHLRVTC